jgi:hypothetical protein
MGTQQHESTVARFMRRKAEAGAATCIHSWVDRTGRTVRLVFVDTYHVDDPAVTVNGQPVRRTVRAHAYVARQRDDGDGWDRKQIGTTAALRLLAEDARHSQIRAAEARHNRKGQ